MAHDAEGFTESDAECLLIQHDCLIRLAADCAGEIAEVINRQRDVDGRDFHEWVYLHQGFSRTATPDRHRLPAGRAIFNNALARSAGEVVRQVTKARCAACTARSTFGSCGVWDIGENFSVGGIDNVEGFTVFARNPTGLSINRPVAAVGKVIRMGIAGIFHGGTSLRRLGWFTNPDYSQYSYMSIYSSAFLHVCTSGSAGSAPMQSSPRMSSSRGPTASGIDGFVYLGC